VEETLKPSPSIDSLAAPQLVAAAQPASAIAKPPNLKSPGARQPFTNSIGMVLAWIPNMPSTSEGGWAGKFEVTQEQFEKVTGANPSASKNAAQPVENVTWQEAMDFCRKLTDQEKNSGILPPGFIYGLPTQAQWDSLLGEAKFEDNVTSRGTPRKMPSVVGSFPPNQLGLCDLLGNVWEWCIDQDSQQKHFAKGGAFDTTMNFKFKPFDGSAPLAPIGSRNPNVGFRCLLIQE
jgi:formylglycine-generating enzyme required for sulfatase activity